MKNIAVNVQRDHITALATHSKPSAAVAELVWNSLDADADQVWVTFSFNKLSGLDTIRVEDNGSGIAYEEAEMLFGSLGGSWKSKASRTAKGRSIHGKSGKGRFKAFSLGNYVDWHTRYRRETEVLSYTVKGRFDQIDTFTATDPQLASRDATGTEVVIGNLHRDFHSLASDKAPQEISKFFAVYLTEFPGIRINYNGTLVDPSLARSRMDELKLPEIGLSDGRTVQPMLTVMEWKEPQDRALHLCDSSGISLHEISPGIQAPGFNFTAYLKSDAIRDLDQKGLLTLEDLHTDVDRLIQAAKHRLREHFRGRALENAGATLQQWKDTNVYPYEGDPQDKVEEAERQVFDVVAVNINSYLSEFEHFTEASKKFTFNLVKQALKENPESLQKIFTDVLNLPKEHQDDLADLLKRTTLPAIISAAKLVANRLDFIRSLEVLLYDKQSKEKLLERDQLHQILAKETWIFGEEFHLTNNEETLNEVLQKYLGKLGKRSDDDTLVQREDGSTGRIDLMLARTVPQPRADEHEHLVIELKRPSKKICSEVLSQVRSYAIAVAQDERFLSTKTRWVFWAISNEMTPEARREAHQRNRPDGLVYDDEELRIAVWAKTWSQLLDECKGRLRFFKENLDYEATRESALCYLKKAHDKYIPAVANAEENLNTPID